MKDLLQIYRRVRVAQTKDEDVKKLCSFVFFVWNLDHSL